MKMFASLLCILCIGFFFSGCGIRWNNYNPFVKHHSKQHYPKPTIGIQPTMSRGFNAHARAGEAYIQSINVALNAHKYGKCPDYMEEEINEIKNESGGAYRDGKWVGENTPDCEE